MKSQSNILLVEDSKEVQIIVKTALGGKYDLTLASTILDARKALSQKNIELILLDVGLPDGDGFKFCTELKTNSKFSNVSVIFLTGKHDPLDKVMGFSIGADDYIVKPFEPLEFGARVDARIRKLADVQTEREVYIKGDFKINTAKQKVYLLENGNETDLNLTTNEFKLLLYFIGHEEHVLSRDKILSNVWGENINVGDRTVDANIYTLRKKLGTHGDDIRSVPRVGYKYIRKSA